MIFLFGDMKNKLWGYKEKDSTSFKKERLRREIQEHEGENKVENSKY